MRQGQPGVQASLELDVTSVEFDEEGFAMAGDMVSFLRSKFHQSTLFIEPF